MAAGSAFDKPVMLTRIVKEPLVYSHPKIGLGKLKVSVRDVSFIFTQAVRLSVSVCSNGPRPFKFGTSVISQESNKFQFLTHFSTVTKKRF